MSARNDQRSIELGREEHVPLAPQVYDVCIHATRDLNIYADVHA